MSRKWNKSCYVVLLIMAMFVLGACGSWEHSANAGETELPEETVSKVEEVQTEIETEVAPLLEFTVNECPSWDIMQQAWDVRGDITYMVRDEMDGATGAFHFVIAGVDRDGKVVEEIPVDFEPGGWIICEGLVAEADGTFTMMVEPPDSLNDGTEERLLHYLRVDAQGNVIKDILLNGLLNCEEMFIGDVAETSDGWLCVTMISGQILVWNPQGEFVGTIQREEYVRVATSGFGKTYGVEQMNETTVFTEVFPGSLTMAGESFEVSSDYLYYLQPGTGDGFIAMDRVGVMEFSLGEEPVYVLKFEDYGLDRVNLWGLQVRGDDILLIEHKMEGEKIPKLWTFHGTSK